MGHPIDGVIKLLQELSEKAKAQGQTEELSYEKFEYWCKNSKKTLNGAIAKEKEQIEQLQSEIAGKEKQASVLTEQIASLEEELGKLEAADAKAKSERASANKLYQEAD